MQWVCDKNISGHGVLDNSPNLSSAIWAGLLNGMLTEVWGSEGWSQEDLDLPSAHEVSKEGLDMALSAQDWGGKVGICHSLTFKAWLHIQHKIIVHVCIFKRHVKLYGGRFAPHPSIIFFSFLCNSSFSSISFWFSCSLTTRDGSCKTNKVHCQVNLTHKFVFGVSTALIKRENFLFSTGQHQTQGRSKLHES